MKMGRVAQFSSTSGVSRETVGARLLAAVTIGAASDIAFQISDLEISVLLQDPRDRSRLTPIATLVPNEPDAVYSVGPLVPEIGPLIFQNTEIFPSLFLASSDASRTIASIGHLLAHNPHPLQVSEMVVAR